MESPLEAVVHALVMLTDPSHEPVGWTRKLLPPWEAVYPDSDV